MTGNPDTSLTIDTHHHILPDFFWQEKARAFEETHHFAVLRDRMERRLKTLRHKRGG